MDERIEIRPGRTVNILVHNNPAATQTIFLFHGLGGRSTQWLAQYEMLKEHHNVVAPDMLGHGKSDKPDSDNHNLYSFQELDQDIKAIFQRYAGERNIVIGHSYGGALSTSLALSNQDKIEKLILISPTPLAPNTKIPFLFTLPAFMMEWLRPILEKNMGRLIFTPDANPQMVQNEIIISRQNPMYVIRATIQGFLSMPNADISSLHVSTLTILGKQDKLIPADLSRRFYDGVPVHETITLFDAGHMALMENAKEVNELILKWCERT